MYADLADSSLRPKGGGTSRQFVLKDYLEQRASEVLSMLFEEFRIEDYGDVRYQDGLLQKAIEAAKNLLGLGVVDRFS